MSFLTIIQRACPLINETKPNSVIGTTTRSLLTLIEIAQEEGEDLAHRHDWQRLTKEKTFSSAATESQGAVTTLIGSDFDHIKNDTVWNRTRNRRIWPINEMQWQALQSNAISGPDEFFRIRANLFIVYPTMTASQTVALEYVSKNWCESSGGTGQAAWAADTDVGVLDEQLMQAGIVWRWKRRFGKPDWETDREIYEKRVANAIARDGAPQRLNLSGPNPIARLLIGTSSVPEGSWTL